MRVDTTCLVNRTSWALPRVLAPPPFDAGPSWPLGCPRLGLGEGCRLDCSSQASKTRPPARDFKAPVGALGRKIFRISGRLGQTLSPAIFGELLGAQQQSPKFSQQIEHGPVIQTISLMQQGMLSRGSDDNHHATPAGVSTRCSRLPCRALAPFLGQKLSFNSKFAKPGVFLWGSSSQSCRWQPES